MNHYAASNLGEELRNTSLNEVVSFCERHDMPEPMVGVYGTLRKNERANHFLDSMEYVETAVFANLIMYNIGSFPAICYGNSRAVIELYKGLDAKTLSQLDKYEGVPTLYNRDLYTYRYRLKDKDDIMYQPVLLYTWSDPEELHKDYDRIVSGDWVNRNAAPSVDDAARKYGDTLDEALARLREINITPEDLDE